MALCISPRADFTSTLFFTTQVLLLCVLAVLVAYTNLRLTRLRRGSPLFPGKKMRYTGVGTWLLLITVPALLWVVAVAPYAVCYSSPVALVIGVALWLLVSFFMSMAALSDPGVIPRAAPGGSVPADEICRTQLINGVEFELKFCTTCGIVRPPMSNPRPNLNPTPKTLTLNPNPNTQPEPEPGAPATLVS